MPGFEFTPEGIIALGQQVSTASAEDLEHNRRAAEGLPRDAGPMAGAEPANGGATPASASTATKRVTAAGLRSAIRRELQTIDRECRRLRALEREGKRLRQMLADLAPKPKQKTSAVRALRAG